MTRRFAYCAAAGLFAVTALVPAAQAQQQEQELRYALVSQIPTLCRITGDIFTASGEGASTTPIVPGGSATVALRLNVPASQEIARVGALCNGGSATVTIDSLNGFRLLNGAGGPNREIAYTVTVAGTNVSAASAQTSYVETDISGSASRSVTVALGTVDVLLLAAGDYRDTMTLSVTPNN